MQRTTADVLAGNLRGNGLRVTASRVAVLNYLQDHHHSTAADIYAGLGSDLPSLSPQSVHNVVGDLTTHGLLRRVDLPDSGGARYEPAATDNHHHVQCVVCGRIEDVACAAEHAPCMTPPGGSGMRILEAAVTYRGVCPECERTADGDDESQIDQQPDKTK